MSQPYDAVVKVLVETEPQAWLPLLDLPLARVTVLDADVSTTISGAADKVIHVHAKPEYLLHLDFQSGHDSSRLPQRLRLYNTVLEDRHGLLVRTVAILLRPEADSPQLTGVLKRQFPGEEPYALWRYSVLRVWQLPAQRFLTAGIGLLPLAPVCQVSRSEVPEIIGQMKKRLRGEKLAEELWTATRILLGLRYSADVADMLLQGVTHMEDSTTYQAIIKKGRVEEARRMLLIVGESVLGAPDSRVQEILEEINDTERLEQLASCVSSVATWQELLQPATPRRRNGRRRSS